MRVQAKITNLPSRPRPNREPGTETPRYKHTDDREYVEEMPSEVVAGRWHFRLRDGETAKGKPVLMADHKNDGMGGRGDGFLAVGIPRYSGGVDNPRPIRNMEELKSAIGSKESQLYLWQDEEGLIFGPNGRPEEREMTQLDKRTIELHLDLGRTGPHIAENYDSRTLERKESTRSEAYHDVDFLHDRSLSYNVSSYTEANGTPASYLTVAETYSKFTEVYIPWDTNGQTDLRGDIFIAGPGTLREASPYTSPQTRFGTKEPVRPEWGQ